MTDRVAGERLAPQSGFYPSLLLSDRQWERVLAALAKSGTKADLTIHDRFERELQQVRRERLSKGLVSCEANCASTYGSIFDCDCKRRSA